VAIVLVMLLPGVCYQAVRERLRGLLPAEKEPGNRLVRAVAVSAVLDSVYVVVAGPWLVGLLGGGRGGLLRALAERPRQAGLTGLLLVVAVPVAVAWAEAWWTARRLRARYEPVPTAWDALFKDRGPCFVRIRLKSGAWLGGWYGGRSNASGYPHPADLYLESQWAMAEDGRFSGRLEGTGGVYVNGAEIEVLEILEPSGG
jgi:hypothetical protein